MNEESLFAAALERAAGAERRALLEDACAGDVALRQRVERLLAAHEKTFGVLDGRAGTPVMLEDRLGTPPGGVLPGSPVGLVVAGRYRLLEEVGAGGMGTVWAAEQTQPVRRKVAVKLVKAGMDTRSVLARFEVERQALALMDHPNIAKVLDAGATEVGRPFFAMEYVEGVPITRYCDDAHLSIPQRLALFVPVCQAVQHAHQKGVIHRDLKPSNVLVARYDGEAVPKVIDFGVAKATGPDLSGQTTLTQDGQIVGTPRYMSPEQAEMGGRDVDTRSDVYSLGVLLYELLTGSTPFERKGLGGAPFHEVLRAIREEEPPTPSRRLSTTEELPGIAARRRTEPARLTRLVRGDLDWIVMKALEKDRDRRYETANGLAMDLKRYLADEVVLARPPGFGYLLRKFVRRNRGSVAAAAALAVLLVAGASAVMAVRAEADRERAAADRERAAAAADRAAREVWASASVAAAVREARERTDEAWDVADDPERMRQASDAADAAVRRAEDFAGGGLMTAATAAEMTAARRAVDDLARHTRLIAARDDSRRTFADELAGQNPAVASAGYCERQAEALRQFGLDPLDGPADEVARAVADSRLRDVLLGMLLEWHSHAAVVAKERRQDPGRVPDSPSADPAVEGRLDEVVRSARRLCGGAYARWQVLLDRGDVPGLVAFAESPDALGFRSGLVAALGRDLERMKQYPAMRDLLRAAVERHPRDAWLRFDLAYACRNMQPPDRPQALCHMAAASALRPDSALFHAYLGECYAGLGSPDRAIAAYRRAIELSPGSATAHHWLGRVLWGKKDADGAIAAFREALRLRPSYPLAQRDLGAALVTVGRHAEGMRWTLEALRGDPAQAEDPRSYRRYYAACLAMNCADGKGGDAPPPAEKSAYRGQALELLTADLAAVRGLAAADRPFVHQRMQRWLEEGDLASVRDPMAAEGLPADERDAWEGLWAEVRDLRDRTAPQGGR